MKVLGGILFWGSGVLLYIWSLGFYYNLWGLTGLVVALVIVPATALFPLVYLVVIGFNASFLLSVILWLLGIVGALLMSHQPEPQNVQ